MQKFTYLREIIQDEENNYIFERMHHPMPLTAKLWPEAMWSWREKGGHRALDEGQFRPIFFLQNQVQRCLL